MSKRIVTAVFALGLAPFALGQGMGMGMGMGMNQSFADLDTDESGAISKEELGKVIPGNRLDMAFSRWDADENGEVSEEEFKNRPGPAGMGG